ncbi:MAG: signal peptidase II [Candidatus Gastranaerophilaceae bacterium]
MKKPNKFLFFLLTFFLFAGVNFYLSNIISHKLLQGWHFSNSLINIVYIENTGAAFSIMQNSTKFLIILSVIALLAIFYYIVKHLETVQPKVIFFLSLLASGIFGNLYERLFFGHVRDFFDLVFINFPIFNLSDIFINIGVLGIIILILLTKKPIKIL